jgi:hypothetical protein
MVGMPEVYLGVDFSLARSVEHVGDLGKRIFILFGEAVETSEVHAQAERAVLFLDEKYWSTVWRQRRVNEAHVEVFIDEFSERLNFALREGVDRTERWSCSIFEINLQVVWSMRCGFVCFGLTEHVGEVMIFFRDGAHVDRSGSGGGSCLHEG